jgi:hypothetical protein
LHHAGSYEVLLTKGPLSVIGLNFSLKLSAITMAWVTSSFSSWLILGLFCGAPLFVLTAKQNAQNLRSAKREAQRQLFFR